MKIKYFPSFFSCFIQIDYAFYFTQLLILALVVVFNTVIYGLVMHRLTCGRKTTSLGRNKRKKETMKRVHNTIAITFLLGLTWVFGLLSLIHEDSSLGFEYLFGIFNSLQGVLIFVMFCVRQEEVVAIWKEWISFGKDQKSHEKYVSQSPGTVSDSKPKTTLANDVTSSEL